MNNLNQRAADIIEYFRTMKVPAGKPWPHNRFELEAEMLDIITQQHEALRAAQERGEAEPVAWRYRYGQEGWQYSDRNPCELLPENTKAVIEPLYAAPAPPVDEQTEMEAFEKWYLDETGSPHYIEKDSSGDYFEQHSRNAWRIWKAARAQRRGE